LLHPHVDNFVDNGNNTPMIEIPLAPGATFLARLPCDQRTARRIADILSESFDPDEIVAGAAETAPDQWSMIAHFRTPPDEAALRALIEMAAGPEAAAATVLESIEPRDWVAASLAGLEPVEAGRFLVHGAHDRDRVGPSRIGIEIEAALAFGTGHHGTTRGCLLALDRLLHVSNPWHVLDIGTGSGVLAIAAAKALRRHVLATDIDNAALKVARDNARLNRVPSLISFVHAPGVGAHDIWAQGPFDLVLANILLGPLKLLAAPIARLTAPGGHVVLSGLLDSHAPAALAAYRAQDLRLERRLSLDGWTTLVLRRGR
jgi:ribosomal protein L11 methyltransferase